MGLFNKFTQNNSVQPTSQRTTRDFILGVAEAEGEASNKDILLRDVFVDYLDIFSQLEKGKFIILGRKGSGKSAIGEYLVSNMEDEPNMFGKLIGHEKIELEQLLQNIPSDESLVKREPLFKWVILTQILNLMAENQHIQDWPEMKLLNNFLKTNRGYVGIDSYEIYDYETSTSFEIKIEYLKRLSTIMGKDWAFKSSKAAYYKILPLLEEAVFDMMVKDSENSYLLVFDDLDIGYKKTKENQDMLVNLLRVVKSYNLSLSKLGLLSRIIILLRDDISKHLLNYSDTAKIFASYSTTLRWYQEADNEDDILLKQFINRRIEYNFNRLGMSYKENDPWGSFIDNTYNFPKTPFKYILDHTFYRPRDLLLVFKDINLRNYPIPISRLNVSSLVGLYASQMIGELRNELSALLQEGETNIILRTICEYIDKNGVSYDALTNALQQAGIEDPSSVIELLFDYSLIGNRNSQGELNFKFREREGHICEMDTRQYFVLHNILRTYARMNYRR